MDVTTYLNACNLNISASLNASSFTSLPPRPTNFNITLQSQSCQKKLPSTWPSKIKNLQRNSFFVRLHAWDWDVLSSLQFITKRNVEIRWFDIFRLILIVMQNAVMNPETDERFLHFSTQQTRFKKKLYKNLRFN